jgi:hypothetical protein
MWTNSVKATVTMFAVGCALAACSAPQATADRGSDLQPVTHDLAKWQTGPDNTSP